jgi:hypothetical protein
VLVVDTYHHIPNRVAYFTALKTRLITGVLPPPVARSLSRGEKASFPPVGDGGHPASPQLQRGAIGGDDLALPSGVLNGLG